MCTVYDDNGERFESKDEKRLLRVSVFQDSGGIVSGRNTAEVPLRAA